MQQKNYKHFLYSMPMKLISVIAAGMLMVSFLPVVHSDTNITESIIAQVNEEMLEYYLSSLVSFGVRYTGTDACYQAEEWIFEQFESMDLNVSYLEWETGGFRDRDVVATLPGDDDHVIIVGAHADTVETSPGADDNGSGVAAVLAVAEVLSRYEFMHTIQFIVYTGEEVGTYGSYNHAREAYANGEKIMAVFNLDMVGYAESPVGGNMIRFFETERGEKLTDFCIDVSTTYHHLIGLDIERVPNYPGSDHQAYIDYGYDAVFSAHYDGYPYGHSANDSIDKINFTYHTKVARLFAAVLAEMANRPVHTYVEIQEPREGYLYVMDHPIMPLTCKTWYLGLRGATIVVGRVTVVAETEGAVEKVIFAVDERMWKWDYDPPYEWKVNAVVLGKHYIRTHAYGEEMAEDEMDILALIPYTP